VPFSVQLYQAIDELDPKTKKVFLALLGEVDGHLNRVVTREDFRDLKRIVESLAVSTKELAAAQQRTEARLEQLAEAQSHLEQRVDQLTEAQRRTEARLGELAEAQKRTEERLDQLAEAQQRTEERVKQLAEAQKKTETELKKLVQEHRKTREQLGGLAHTVGYRLEDEAFKALPVLLKQDVGVEVQGRLKRDFLEIGPDRYLEVNIWGTGLHNGKQYVIIGEAKTQLKKKDVDDFLEKARQVANLVARDQIRLLVTYQASPPVQKYARDKGIALYFSYDF